MNHITNHSSGFVGLRFATPHKTLNSSLCEDSGVVENDCWKCICGNSRDFGTCDADRNYRAEITAALDHHVSGNGHSDRSVAIWHHTQL